MFDSLHPVRFGQFIRYLLAGGVNTLFGFAVYALLVFFGLNIFLAQLLMHIAGVGFNYVTYSRAVFRPGKPAKVRFFFSYMLNYLISAAILAITARLFSSAYLAGLVTIMIVALLNYGVLKYHVFSSRSVN